MVASLQANTHPNMTGTTLDKQYRRMAGRDGIREDYTGTAFAMTLSTSSPTLKVAAAGKSALVDGNLLDFSDVVTDPTLDPRDVGVQPTGSQIRSDLVVLRYDGAVETIADRGRLAIKPGAPGATSVVPTVQQSRGGTWEVEVGSYVFPATGGLLTTPKDLRSWSGDHAFILQGVPIRGPIGSTREQEDGVVWRRTWSAAGGGVWVSSAPAGPVEWAWTPGAMPQQVDVMTSGDWATVRGSTLGIPVVEGRWYRMQSLCTVRADPNTARKWRASIWAGNVLLREVGGMIANGPLVANETNEWPVNVSGYWRASVTGTVAFQTRFAVDGPLAVYARYTSPVSAVEDLGVRR